MFFQVPYLPKNMLAKLFLIEFESNCQDIGFMLQSPWIVKVDPDDYENKYYESDMCSTSDGSTSLDIEIAKIQSCLTIESYMFDFDYNPSDDEMRDFESQHVRIAKCLIAFYRIHGLNNVTSVRIKSTKWIEHTFASP